MKTVLDPPKPQVKEPQETPTPTAPERTTVRGGTGLALRALVKVLGYLYVAKHRDGREYVSISEICADLRLPHGLVVVVLKGLKRAGCVRLNRESPDQVGFHENVLHKTLDTLVAAIRAQEEHNEEASGLLRPLSRISVEDILPVPAHRRRTPVWMKAAATTVFGVLFLIGAFGLYRMPLAFAGAGASMLLVSALMHWIGSRTELEILPRCYLEAAIAGSLLWVVFGVVHFIR